MESGSPTSSSCSFIFNVKYSIRRQMLTLLSICAAVSILVVLAIGIGLFESIRVHSTQTATDGIESRTIENILLLGQEVGALVEQRFLSVSASATLGLASQAAFYLSSNASDLNGRFPFIQTPSFYEFDFFDGCAVGSQCPSDYGPLDDCSRLPPDLSGSILHSSIYLYDSATGCAIKDNITAAELIQSTTALQNVISQLAFLDNDFIVLGSRLNTTVQFYTSSKIVRSDNSYVAVHRSYPGLPKDTVACPLTGVYDSSKRAWFTSAVAAGPGLVALAADRNVFTGALTMTLSTSTQVIVNGLQVQVVTAAAMDVSDMASLVAQQKFMTQGFAAVVRIDTNEVMFYGNQSPPFIDTSSRFSYISDLNPGLSLVPNLATITSGLVISHTNTNSGDDYYVAQVPILSGKLALLFYALKNEAFAPLPDLEKASAFTTNEAIGLLCGLAVITTILVTIVVLRVTGVFREPLDALSLAANRILVICSEDVRNYRAPDLRVAIQTGQPEIDALVRSFGTVLDNLAAVEDHQLRKPRYAPNPLYIGSDGIKTLGLTATELSYYGQDPVILATIKTLPLVLSPPTYQESLVTSHPLPLPLPSAPDHALHIKMDDVTDQKSHSVSAVNPPRYDPVVMIQPSSLIISPMPPSRSLPSRSLPSQPQRPPQTTCCTLHSRIRYPVFVTLFIGLIIMVVVPIVIIGVQGPTWMDATTAAMYSSELTLLSQVAKIKSQYVHAFFATVSVDLAVATAVTSLILNQAITRTNWSSNNDVYVSFTLDNTNPLRNPHSSSIGSTAFSGYYMPLQENCIAATCATCNVANITRLSSIIDAKWRGSMYSGTLTSYFQLGLQGVGDVYSQGFTRIYPYKPKPSYPNPTSCLVDATPAPSHCQNCQSTGFTGTYKTYDARCHSSGLLVLTAAMSIVSSTGVPLGTLSSNVLATAFSAAINSRRFLTTGYVYMFSLTSSVDPIALVHPLLTNTCTTLSCLERFSSLNMMEFNTKVFNQVQSGLSGSTSLTRSDGSLWHFTFTPVDVGTNIYALIATVSDSDILSVSDAVESRLQSTIRSQIITYVVIFLVTGVLLWFAMSALSLRISTPIQELRLLMESIAKGDLNRGFTSRATSSEMNSILNAFSGMLICLRLGSESYRAGDIDRAVATFTEALALYQKLGNDRGAGIAYNNLAQAQLRQNKLADSQTNNMYAIAMARKHLDQSVSDAKLVNAVTTTTTVMMTGPGDTTIRKNKRVLSDRLANLASLLLENNRMDESQQVLDEGTRLDDECDNLRGLVIKRGIRGQVLQKLGRHDDAVRLFLRGLEIIAESEVGIVGDNAIGDAQLINKASRRFDLEDMKVGRQFYLLFIGSHFLATNRPVEARWCFIQSMVLNPICDLSAISRAFAGLRETYEYNVSGSPGRDEIKASLPDNRQMIRHLNAALVDLKLPSVAIGGTTPNKDVVFVLDYSGSMAGPRIQRSVENMLVILDQFVKQDDHVAFIRFNANVEVVFNLTPRAQVRRDLLANSITPDSGTAFFDAVNSSLNLITTSARSKWFIVLLTDGEDNESKFLSVRATNNTLLYVNTLVPRIAASGATLIVIGVALQQSSADMLRVLTRASQGGAFLDVATDSAERLREAFVAVGKLIQGHNLNIESF